MARLAPLAAVVNGFCWQLYDGRVTTPFPADEVAAAAGAAGLTDR